MPAWAAMSPPASDANAASAARARAFGHAREQRVDVDSGRTRAEPGTIASQTPATISAVSASSTCKAAMGR